MAKPFKGVINVDVTDSVPDWGPYAQPIAPEGTPSVLYIVLDDVGYSAMEPFGGLIETPNINRIAERGMRVNRRRSSSDSESQGRTMSFSAHPAVIDVSGDPFVDLAQEARMAFARD